MKRLAQFISLAALVLILVPGLLYLAGGVALAPVKAIALLGTVLWFLATPLWMGRKLPVDADQVEI